MEWLGDFLNIGATAASGGVLGLVGAVVGSISKGFQRKQELKEKKAEWEHEVRLLEMQQSRDTMEDRHEAEMMGLEGSFAGLESSINAEGKISDVHKWVNDVRALTRPVLTIGLVVIVVYLFNHLMAAIQTGDQSALVDLLGREAVVALLTYIVYSVVFSAATAIAWWFGDRALTPPGYKGR